MKGFSLFELIVVLGLLALVAGVGPLALHNFKRTADLDSAFNLVQDSLIRARTRAGAGERDSKWGVKLLNNKAITFSGASYASRTIALDEEFDLPKTIISSGATEMVFSKLNALPNASGAITLTNSLNESRCISVDIQGALIYGC